VVFFLSLYTAFAFGILFLLFAAIPYTFQRPPYNFTISQTGLVFIAVGVGVGLAALTGIVLDRTIYQKKHIQANAKGRQHARPEHRLYSAMVGSIGIPIGLFWFAWTADKGVHWAVPVVATVPFAWGNLCLFVSHHTIACDPSNLTFAPDLDSALHDRRLWPNQWSFCYRSERRLQIHPRCRIPAVYCTKYVHSASAA
jgi:hypothetical protein